MDRRDAPKYPVAEAAWVLGLPPSTVRRWLARDEGRGVIAPAREEPLSLSFFNLAELYVLATIRRRHGVSLQSVRRALATLGRLTTAAHVLIAHELLTDGASLFTAAYGDLVNLSKAGQSALADLLAASIRRIDLDAEGLPLRLYPWRTDPGEPKLLVIDPAVSFGRVAVAGTGIPVEILAERWQAGDSLADLARAYRLDECVVEEAVRWGTRAAAA